jgi:23S rRNA pseudouridine2457 synthase
LSLSIKEGKNRQVRRMTAKVGYPTLRLIRSQIGLFSIEGLEPGAFRHATADEISSFNQKPVNQP